MENSNYVEYVREHIIAAQRLAEKEENVTMIVKMCIESIQNGGSIYLVGNGGSAADCQHMATELVVRFQRNRQPLPALALTSNASVITAVSNDFVYDDVFSRQVDAFGKAGDVLFCLSTSGESKSVIKAIEMAKSKEMKTICITGGNENSISRLCDVSFQIDSNHTSIIQEQMLIIEHFICQELEDNMDKMSS